MILGMYWERKGRRGGEGRKGEGRRGEGRGGVERGGGEGVYRGRGGCVWGEVREGRKVRGYRKGRREVRE